MGLTRKLQKITGSGEERKKAVKGQSLIYLQDDNPLKHFLTVSWFFNRDQGLPIEGLLCLMSVKILCL